MSEIYEEDILGAGKKQVIISNDNTKVVIVPELGGRIADVQTGDVKFLHRTYPEGVNFGPYTEYGGIEECIGGAPGTLWNANWKWEQKNGGVFMQCRSKSTLLRKLITLDDTKPVIKIIYSFFSFGATFSKFTFGIHPEVSIGGSTSLVNNRYHIPTGGELLNGGYAEPGFKSMLPPSEGWCAITHEGKVFGQMFPEGVFDVIQLYYPKINTHIILEPIIFGVGMSPETCAEFTYMLYMGDGDADTVKEMRAERGAELTIRYEPFDTAEVPATLMDELEDGAAQAPAPEGIPTRVAVPGAPLIPKVQIPDVGAIIQNALKGLKGMQDVKLAGMKGDIKVSASPTAKPKTGKPMRTDDLPPNTEIAIEHLKGNIVVHGWEQPYVDYSEVKGTVGVGQDGDVTHVKVDASGDYSLGVPRNVSRISLNFVNGSASMSGIGSSLRVSGVNGSADIAIVGVPEGAELIVSLVKGNVNMSIPDDSSCIISASNLSGGEISCNLPLDDEERTRTQLKGVLNEGRAKVILSTVKGDISINAVRIETIRVEQTEDSGEADGDETVEDADSQEVTGDE